MKRNLRLIVCGGRDYNNKMFVFSILDSIHNDRGIALIIEGGALGADRLSREWAISRSIPYETCDADWGSIGKPDAVVKTRSDGKKYNAKAGFDRNADMLTKQPDGVVAFPGGRGTADMIRQSVMSGVKVYHPSV